MKAVGYRQPGQLDRDDALLNIEIDCPAPGPRDLLVEVAAVSVNPVDAKIRKTTPAPDGQWKVLGWDAAGRVVAIGADVTGFAVGDAVFYAGSISRQGANSQFHLVDERIAARRPEILSDAAAAALPLTAITAWEMLFDRLDVARPVPGAANAILIIGGAGGVGSIAIQLARALTDLTVIATASRPETTQWVTDLGAHHVLDHSLPLAAQVEALGLGAPGFVFSTTKTHLHLAEIAQLISPQGRLGLIDDPEHFDLALFKRKSVSTHWEFMFTRALFTTPDMHAQGHLLGEISRLVDEGRLSTTLNQSLSPINAVNLRQAHELIESGKAMGKIVLCGWGNT